MAGDVVSAADPDAVQGDTGTIYEDSFGTNTIALSDGTDLTVYLGPGFDTVIGADDADTIYGGTGGYDTVILGSERESFYASAEGATIKADAAFLGATIDGGGRSELDITGADRSVALGANLSGIAVLGLDVTGLTLDTGPLDAPLIELQGSGNDIILRSAGQAIEDESGGNAIGFCAAGETLVLPYADLPTGNPANPYGGETADMLTGFAAGDTIEVAIPYSTADALSFDPGDGMLVLSEGPGGYAQTIDLVGTYDGTFQVQKAAQAIAGLYGTDITYEAADPPCFCAGSRILTPDGEIAVEHLRVGETVLTASGRAVPIVWIGRRRVDCRRHPRSERVMPVRVCAGAFGPGMPRRDLLLSPDHAVAADGVLIPVQHLVNDTTVRREAVESVAYVHVELPAHDILLAEGLTVESYLDTGNRGQFGNAAGPIALHPDFSSPGRGASCAPLVQDGPRLRRVRARLEARARRLGHAARPLRLLVDGREVSATRCGSACIAVLGAPANDVRLVAAGAVRRVVLRDGAGCSTVAVGDRRPGEGPELRLSAACWDGMTFPLLIELHLDAAA